jgi:hypothetical protein
MHFRRSRRLIPASAYYEWQDTAVGKQPWYFTPADGEPITFAGLWDEWKTRRLARSCTMIITEPNDFVVEVHGRMPVILARNSFAKGALQITFAGSNPACPTSQCGLYDAISGRVRTADIPAR